jgi:NADP-dependent 3-hydroxy acid dehydrogenase YdfG
MDGKLALATGASSGIGLELAKELANRGYDVVEKGSSIYVPTLRTADALTQPSSRLLQPNHMGVMHVYVRFASSLISTFLPRIPCLHLITLSRAAN